MTKGNFLTLKEVAKHLKVSERSVLRYINLKKLTATKIGYWRIREKDLENFINKNLNIKKKK